MLSTESPRPSVAPAPALSWADWVVEQLVSSGIDTLFGLPGGAILPLYDALARAGVRHVLARHEQAAAFMAQGLARATGGVGVVLATSGPGATNLLTALADAQCDSVPVLALTAQVPRALMGTQAFQEVDTIGLSRPITKACWFAATGEQLKRILPVALRLCLRGRPGAVLVDIPKDLLAEPVALSEGRRRQVGRAHLPASVPASPPVQPARASGADTARGRRATPSRAAPRPGPQPDRPRAGVGALLAPSSDRTWQELASRLADSRRPLLYVGGGCVPAAAALRFAMARGELPAVCSLHGLGALPTQHPLNLGMLGMHGRPRANWATEEADLVVALGARFDDRATGRLDRFCPRASIVHIDIDPREIGRLMPTELGVVCDAQSALPRLARWLPRSRRPEWRRRLRALKSEDPLNIELGVPGLLRNLGLQLPPGCFVTTDVGQHQMWAAQALPLRRARSWLTSGGLGTMGFGLPAALGVAFAAPQRSVLCVTGDGSLLMNVQELATLAEHALNVTVLVLNNQQLGMVRQQQSQFFGGRLAQSRFRSSPDFAAIARAFGVPGVRVDARGARLNDPEVAAALTRAVRRPGPALVDCRIDGGLNVLPIVPPGAANAEMRFA